MLPLNENWGIQTFFQQLHSEPKLNPASPSPRWVRFGNAPGKVLNRRTFFKKMRHVICSFTNRNTSFVIGGVKIKCVLGFFFFSFFTFSDILVIPIVSFQSKTVIESAWPSKKHDPHSDYFGRILGIDRTTEMPCLGKVGSCSVVVRRDQKLIHYISQITTKGLSKHLRWSVYSAYLVSESSNANGFFHCNPSFSLLHYIKITQCHFSLSKVYNLSQ